MLNAGSKGVSQMNVNVIAWTNAINLVPSVNYKFPCKSIFPHVGLNMHPWTVFCVGISSGFLRNVHSGNSEENK